MTKALFQIVDPRRSSQLIPLEERMRRLKTIFYGPKDDRLEMQLWHKDTQTKGSTSVISELIPLGRSVHGKRKLIWQNGPNFQWSATRKDGEALSLPSLYMMEFQAPVAPTSLTVLTEQVGVEDLAFMLCRQSASKDSHLRCFHVENNMVQMPRPDLKRPLEYLHLGKEHLLGFSHFGIELLRKESAPSFLMAQVQYADDYKIDVDPGIFSNISLQLS
jgi:hypothetical protein